LVTAQGRLIVSVADPSQSGITVGKPLSDQEDRVHSHGYSSSLNLPQKDVAAIGCCNNQGGTRRATRLPLTLLLVQPATATTRPRAS
jgi:hypothetical protein